uniref:Uncharacterized protein n=1 Tax=Oryza rufipogon TaxID=4529 RepID=A0A0E0QW00_ORYRU
MEERGTRCMKYEEQWLAKDDVRFADEVAAEELLHARVRRAQRLAVDELLQPHVGVGLHENHPFRRALHNQLTSSSSSTCDDGELPEAAGQWVEAHQRLRQRCSDDTHQVTAIVVVTTGEDGRSVMAATEELDSGGVELQSTLGVNVGEDLVLVRGWPRRCHELRLSPVRGEDGHYSLIEMIDGILACWVPKREEATSRVLIDEHTIET